MINHFFQALTLIMFGLKECAAKYSCNKDTCRIKEPSNGTAALTKSMKMDFWVVGTSNKFFIGGF